MAALALVMAPGAARAEEAAAAAANADGASGSEERAMEQVMFGAGCFWGVEVTFRNTKGVQDAVVGYSGGHTENPTYKQVCAGDTGHAEVVHVTYDPAVISFEELLEVFWECHDPTQVNRQGPDVGDQYRTAIFYYTEAQKAAAEKSKAALDASGKLRRPVATEIAAAKSFYKGEEYHQRYLEKRGLATCPSKSAG
jgi:peptide-methionine (S)-S-oxide reductase